MEADDTDKSDSVPNEDGPPVTHLGDVWQIGAHRVICGDSGLPETYAALLGDEMAAMVFADPPYNVKIDGHVCGLGKVHHREFAMASGEMSPEEFTSFLTRVFVQLAENTVDGAIHFQKGLEVDAVLVGNGRTFDGMADDRADELPQEKAA